MWDGEKVDKYGEISKFGSKVFVILGVRQREERLGRLLMNNDSP